MHFCTYTHTHTHTHAHAHASLDMLQREHNDWVKMKLRQMAAYVGQFSDIVQKEVEFVESYPLEQLLKEDATPLLREVDQLVASQVGVRVCVHVHGCV